MKKLLKFLSYTALILFIPLASAEITVLYQQNVHDTNTTLDYVNLGTGLTGEIDHITVWVNGLGGVGAGRPDRQIQLLCYSDEYTTLVTDCSVNWDTGNYSAVPSWNLENLAEGNFERTTGDDQHPVLNPARWYRLKIVETASGSEGSYVIGNSSNVPYFKIYGTGDYISNLQFNKIYGDPEVNKLNTFQLTWTGSTFIPHTVVFYPDENELENSLLIPMSGTRGYSGNFEFNYVFTQTGAYNPVAVVGNYGCRFLPGSTGSLVIVPPCVFQQTAYAPTQYIQEVGFFKAANDAAIAGSPYSESLLDYASGSTLVPKNDSLYNLIVNSTGSLFKGTSTASGALFFNALQGDNLISLLFHKATGFGNTNSPLLNQMASYFDSFIGVIIVVLNIIFNFLMSNSAVYSWFSHLFHPPPGLTLEVGATLFGLPVPDIAGTEFTTNYAPNTGGYYVFGLLVQLVVTVSIFIALIRAALFD